MKKKITVTIDQGLYRGLRLDNKNVSGFINELLEEKLISSNRVALGERLTQEVKTRLLEDEQFFQELKQRIGVSSNGRTAGFEPVNLGSNPSVPTTVAVLPCCLNTKQPCKHWTFDGAQQAYVNSLTGEIREV